MTTTSPETKPALPASEDTLNEPLDNLTVELSRISAEILSINSGFQAQMQQVLGDLKESLESQYREQFEQARAQLRETLQKEIRESLAAKQSDPTETKKEIERVCQQIVDIDKEITTMLDDPDVELAKVIRRRSELTELKSYLSGLRFSIGE